MNDVELNAAIQAVDAQIVALGERLQSRMRTVAALVDPTLSPLGLRLLRTVHAYGPVHAGVTAEKLGIDPSVVSRLVRQLEQLELIEVSSDPSDRRARLLAMTATGAERLTAAGPAGRDQLTRSLRTWSPDDVRRFSGYLERLVEE